MRLIAFVCLLCWYQDLQAQAIHSPHKYPVDVYDPKYAWNTRFDDTEEPKGKSVRLTVRTMSGTVLLTRRLGSGSFGEVYKGEFLDGDLAGKKVALKRDFQRSPLKFRRGFKVPFKYTEIEHEFDMMYMLRNKHGFPEVYAANFAGRNKYYVMELLGRSLQAIRTNGGTGTWRFPAHVAVPIAIQMLNRVQTVHNAGYIAYDLHFGNFLIKEETNTVYMIDLGMAYPYIIDGRHITETQSPIPYKPKMHEYTSRQDERDLISSRRDDVERLLFLVVKLMVRRLPWDRAKDISRIRKFKVKTLTPSIICKNLPWLEPAFKHVFGLAFDEEPDYEFIQKVLESGKG
jgi:serine/threonine protein kinase